MGLEQTSVQRIALNGRAARVEELAVLAQVNYGHFTTMQVRDGCARGFALHLQRLAEATRTLFDSELDVDQVRSWATGMLDERPQSLRITVFSMAFDQARPEHPLAVDVFMTSRAPSVPKPQPMRLQSAHYGRTLPQIKHIGMFDLLHQRRQARIAGFDDVLLTTIDGEISEGSTWNIGFWDGRRVIWPTAPALPGISQRLLDSGLKENGIDTLARPVHLNQLAEFRGAFMLNSGSVGPMIESVDSQRIELDAELLPILAAAYESQPMEKI